MIHELVPHMFAEVGHVRERATAKTKSKVEPLPTARMKSQAQARGHAAHVEWKREVTMGHEGPLWRHRVAL